MPRVMLAIVAALLFGAFFAAAPASALRADVQAAVEAVDKLRADKPKVQQYCAIQAEIESAGDDEAKLDQAFEKMDAFFDSLGDAYAPMFAIEDELDPNSDEARALDEAFNALDRECQS